MKKLALILASAIAAFSCSREMEVEIPEPVQNNDPSAWVVRFNATQTDTKAQFGELENGAYPTLWTTNDTEVKLSLNYGSATGAAVTPASDKRTASFAATFDFTGLNAPYVFYSVSPSSAAKALSPSREAWKVTIPCTQSPSATSVDEAGIILAATSDAYSEVTDISEVNLYFNHLTAYGRLSLANLALETGETVSGVELTITTPIVGDWYWNTSGSAITDYGASSTLTINTTRTDNIWFACAPVDVSNQAMTVTVFTSLGYHEQLVEFPANRQFEAGRTAVFTVDMDGAGFVAAGSGGSGTPVTVSMDTFSAVSGYVNGDENVSYEAAQGTAQTPPAVNSDEIRIYQNGGLLTVTANNGKTISNVTIGSSMATTVQVNIDGGGYGSDNSISANGTFSTGTISASTVVFKCTGTDKSHRLYLNSLSVTYEGSGGGVSTADPLLDEDEYGCYLGSSSLTWAFNAGTEQVTRSYDANGVQTYTLIDPSEVEELEILGYKKSYVKGDSFTVSVHWRKGISTIHSESYNVTLIKETGPKVWLSTGTGKGFIIKK